MKGNVQPDFPNLVYKLLSLYDAAFLGFWTKHFISHIALISFLDISKTIDTFLYIKIQI